MCAAYDRLPAQQKSRIEGLSTASGYGGRSRQGFDLLEPEDRAKAPADHPIVRTHLGTGRKSLYVKPTHNLGIVGLPTTLNLPHDRRLAKPMGAEGGSFSPC